MATKNSTPRKKERRNAQKMRDQERTVPSAEKCFSSSLLVILGDNPVTYKLFPGFSTSLDGLLKNKLRIHKIRIYASSYHLEKVGNQASKWFLSRKYLERLLDLDRDLETDRLNDGEREYLDLREYDICNQTRKH